LVPIDVVLFSVIAQEVRSAAFVLPVVDQSMAFAVVRVPCAVPVNFKSSGQVVLNDPFAATGVCSVMVYLKFVQVFGVGIIVDDV